MSDSHLQNWMALYAATSALCAIGAAAATVTILLECGRDKVWCEIRSVRSAALFLPRFWLKWQLRYLCGTPVILAIVTAFAFSMDWSA